MFAGFFAGILGKIIPWAIIGVWVVGGWLLIQHKNTVIELEEEKNSHLIGIVDAKDIEIKQKDADNKHIRELNIEVSKKWSAAISERNTLAKKFTETAAGAPRDFTAIAASDPKKMEEKINRGTRFALRCNEIVTGSPVKETDKDNTICPEAIRKKMTP